MAHSDPQRSFLLTFTGSVQGVGFRYSTQRLAQDLGMTGWVRNLPNGSVELYAEGTLLQLNELLASIERQFSVRDVKMSEGEPSGRHSSFEVRF